MNTIILFAVQELEDSKAYKIGYEVGYFVGSHFWTTVSIAVLLFAVILYLAFFRRKGKSNRG